MSRIGIVGLGSMGSGIALNLLKKGYALQVFVRQPAAAAAPYGRSDWDWSAVALEVQKHSGMAVPSQKEPS